MKQYPEYKDSGIEWLGRVPKHWEITRLGYHSEMIVPMRDKPTDLCGEIPWLRIEDFDGKYVSRSKTNQGVSLEMVQKMNLKIHPVGTVLCSCSCNMGKTAIVQVPLVTNQTFIGIVPNKDISSDFLFYLMQSSEKHLNVIATGAIQSYLSRDDFEKLRIPFPCKDEQNAITFFIDHKIHQINNLITKKQKLIDLLKEYRAAIIYEAVTKGLNPNVPMRDSGIERLGEIPKNWKITKLKYNAIIFNGSTPDTGSPEYWDGNIEWVTPSDISKNNTIEISDSLRKITEIGLANCGTNLIPKNSIILTTRAPIGNLAINSVELCTNQGCKAIVPINGNPYFYYYQMLIFSDILVSLGSGTTFKELSTPALSDFLVAMPPVHEQSEIASFLHRKNDAISATINSEERQIEYLLEYKTSLINEAVTGKIDVRNYVTI